MTKYPSKQTRRCLSCKKQRLVQGFFNEQTELFVFICGNSVNIGSVMSTEKCQMAH